MKIIAYAVRKDELEAFESFSKQLNVEVTLINESLSPANVDLAKGYDGVSFLGNCMVNKEVLETLNSFGIKFLASRSIGYNNVDLETLRALDMKLSNSSYSPHCVADFSVMMMLMAIRKVKTTLKRLDADDYSLAGLQGREMHNLTFGIIGTGRIGAATAKNLTGFGGKILGYDVYENDDLRNTLEYVDLDTLLKESDVISLHAPLLPSTTNIINAENLTKAKDGVVIINCARNELINTPDLIAALDSGKVGAAGLDVFPGEVGIVHNDHRLNILDNHELSILKGYKNVIITPHNAFYTDQAVSDMVEASLTSLESFNRTNESPWEVK